MREGGSEIGRKGGRRREGAAEVVRIGEGRLEEGRSEGAAVGRAGDVWWNQRSSRRDGTMWREGVSRGGDQAGFAAKEATCLEPDAARPPALPSPALGANA